MTTRQQVDYSAPTDWAELAEYEAGPRQPPTPRHSFVPAAPPKLEMPALHLSGATETVVPPAAVQSIVTGSHDDRAKAWLRYSLPLCAGFALAILVLLAVATPLFQADMGESFLRAAGVFFGVFVVSYAVLLVHYWAQSPEGQALLHTRLQWRHAEREQAHRQAIERDAWEIAKEQYQKRLEG